MIDGENAHCVTVRTKTKGFGSAQFVKEVERVEFQSVRAVESSMETGVDPTLVDDDIEYQVGNKYRSAEALYKLRSFFFYFENQYEVKFLLVNREKEAHGKKEMTAPCIRIKRNEQVVNGKSGQRWRKMDLAEFRGQVFDKFTYFNSCSLFQACAKLPACCLWPGSKSRGNFHGGSSQFKTSGKPEIQFAGSTGNAKSQILKNQPIRYGPLSIH